MNNCKITNKQNPTTTEKFVKNSASTHTQAKIEFNDNGDKWSLNSPTIPLEKI